MGENTCILSFTDYEDISDYAIAPMQYVVGAGIISGKTAETLNPKDTATRAEIAAVLHRFIEAEK
ncbi:MAG: S-layer homology domain-containing protein [Clostridia bacterium]|nr:S-layer homology domain-containing protein [Clostridia bacterium]